MQDEKALYHQSIKAYLTGLHHTPEAGLDLLKAVGDIVVVDASAAVVNQNCAEAEILGVEGGGSCNYSTIITLVLYFC